MDWMQGARAVSVVGEVKEGGGGDSRGWRAVCLMVIGGALRLIWSSSGVGEEGSALVEERGWEVGEEG